MHRERASPLASLDQDGYGVVHAEARSSYLPHQLFGGRFANPLAIFYTRSSMDVTNGHSQRSLRRASASGYWQKHMGSEVREGRKYVLRSDVMFQRTVD